MPQLKVITKFMTHLISSCCSADMTGVWLDTEICPDCKDHCSIEDVTEEDEANLMGDEYGAQGILMVGAINNEDCLIENLVSAERAGGSNNDEPIKICSIITNLKANLNATKSKPTT